MASNSGEFDCFWLLVDCLMMTFGYSAVMNYLLDYLNSATFRAMQSRQQSHSKNSMDGKSYHLTSEMTVPVIRMLSAAASGESATQSCCQPTSFAHRFSTVILF